MELSLLKKMYNENKEKGFSLIAINCNPNEERDVKTFNELGLEYFHLQDKDANYKNKELGAVFGFPCSMILNENLQVISIHYDFIPGQEVEINHFVKRLLAS